MSKELIEESVKATIELLEKTQDTLSITENFMMNAWLGHLFAELHNKSAKIILMKEILDLVRKLSKKSAYIFNTKDELTLKVTIGDEYDDNGYSLGVVGERSGVTANFSDDDVVELCWDWIYSLDSSDVEPWLQKEEGGTIVIKITDLSILIKKIKSGGGTVSKQDFLLHVDILN